jgi:cytoskeleton-associated protein 5
MAEQDDGNFERLPLEERLGHKSWKARQHGYEEAARLCAQLDEGDAGFDPLRNHVASMILDANVPAQLMGLTAAAAFVENAGK